jgi:hypothetical protein
MLMAMRVCVCVCVCVCVFLYVCMCMCVCMRVYVQGGAITLFCIAVWLFALSPEIPWALRCLIFFITNSIPWALRYVCVCARGSMRMCVCV